MQTYCERCGPGLLDEPINAVSNVVFLVAAWAAWRAGARQRVLTPGLWSLIGLSVAVGIGSGLWHTFATRWAMLLDIVPIMLFQFTGLWLYGRHAAHLPVAVVGAALAGYIGIGFWLSEYKEWLNGALVYAPAVALSWAVGLHHAACGRQLRFGLVWAAATFCLALVCRSIDLLVCRQFPVGTHFLWHVFNGLVVYLTMRVLITVWCEYQVPVPVEDDVPDLNKNEDSGSG